MKEFEHIPVLLNECIEGLKIKEKGIWVLYPHALKGQKLLKYQTISKSFCPLQGDSVIRRW